MKYHRERNISEPYYWSINRPLRNPEGKETSPNPMKMKTQKITKLMRANEWIINKFIAMGAQIKKNKTYINNLMVYGKTKNKYVKRNN